MTDPLSPDQLDRLLPALPHLAALITSLFTSAAAQEEGQSTAAGYGSRHTRPLYLEQVYLFGIAKRGGSGCRKADWCRGRGWSGCCWGVRWRMCCC